MLVSVLPGALHCSVLLSVQLFKSESSRSMKAFPSKFLSHGKVLVQIHKTMHQTINKVHLFFPKGNSIPSVKVLTFFRTETFSVDVQCHDQSDTQGPTKISPYTIGPFKTENGEKGKIKLKVFLNLHGIVTIALATLFKEEEIEVRVTKESAEENAKMETDEAPAVAPPPSSNDIDVNMQDAKATTDTNGAVNGVPETGDKPMQMDIDAKVEAPKEKGRNQTFL